MINTDNRKAGPLNCNGITTVFAFGFKCFADTDPVVVLADSNGVEATLVKDTDYTVALNADQDANPGGTITTIGASSPRATGNTITITTDLTETQGTQLPNGGGWFPKVVENALDKLTILCQQLVRDVARSIRQPVTDSTAIGQLPSKANRAGKIMAFDSNGDPSVTTGGITGVAVETVVQVLDTITALKALAVPTVAVTYLVRGFAAKGDGGGGFYFWNAADATADNGGTVIALDLGGLGRFNKLF